MPQAAPRPCSRPGCGVLTTTGRCEQHQVKHGWGDDRERGTRQDRGYGKKYQRERKYIFRRDNKLCQPCLAEGRTTPATEIDHVIPYSMGGDDNHTNKQAICDDCHKAKTAKERG